jgi:hypothetical protein
VHTVPGLDVMQVAYMPLGPNSEPESIHIDSHAGPILHARDIGTASSPSTLAGDRFVSLHQTGLLLTITLDK